MVVLLLPFSVIMAFAGNIYLHITFLVPLIQLQMYSYSIIFVYLDEGSKWNGSNCNKDTEYTW